MEKVSVRVMVQDEHIVVSVDYGEWVAVESNSQWLSVLGAVCYPEDRELMIQDHRTNRESYQRKLSTDHPEEV